MKRSDHKHSTRPAPFLRRRDAIFAAIAAIWLVFLTGVFGSRGYAPGLVQSRGLKRLLDQKKAALAVAEDEAASLLQEKRRLENEPAHLEREVRKSLGVLRAQELMIEFDAPLR